MRGIDKGEENQKEIKVVYPERGSVVNFDEDGVPES